MGKKHEYVIGNIYNKQRLLSLEYINGRLCAHVECICCGKQKTMRASDLYNEKTNSCLCQLEKPYDCSEKLYSVYYNMKDRCYNPNNHAFKNYGGKGVRICDEWLGDNGYPTFYNWAKNAGYKEGLSIDRIDSNGNYEPSNCHWITLSENVGRANKENARRKANNGRYYGYDGNGKYYEFDNANEFGREHDLSGSMIRSIANGYRKTPFNGWIFGFVNSK